MSHRKVRSQGSIPFSWEDKPGVSKTPNHDYSIHIGIGSVDAKNERSKSSTFQPQAAAAAGPAIEESKIPLPPCPLQMQAAPRRSILGKGFKWQQEDPFLVAYKECTKDVKPKNKALGSAYYKLRKSKSILSCKSSTDAKDDHFVKLSRLPPLPRDKNPSFALRDKHRLDFNYESWI
ncbi:hypothetical protein L6164_027944 [Bauhinia variegata]|uniref:Uncharacterized protein n=1 Tax=Bauhinia variegata TaxID=167791 RepID=A0ACB9LW83_BAUVA|nr:hypothetical protein L6164_027944 [Bauhinia variegata]